MANTPRKLEDFIASSRAFVCGYRYRYFMPAEIREAGGYDRRLNYEGEAKALRLVRAYPGLKLRDVRNKIYNGKGYPNGDPENGPACYRYRAGVNRYGD